MAEEVASPTRSTPSPTPTSRANYASTSVPSRLNTSSPLLRNRLLSRNATGSHEHDKLDPQRRGSMLSVSSLDDARKSIRSSTDNLLLPKPSNNHQNVETSVWQSSPLIFALLPAVGGMVFTNGSAVVTDITLLGLAAVFLNWSVRLPWEWYQSAQSVATDDPYPPDAKAGESQDENEDEDNEITSSSVAQDNFVDGERPAEVHPARAYSRSSRYQAANKELRVHELLALLTCFVFPLLGAYLLHAIRGQLSRPSEGLVSDYNLTIFMLAAEMRPLAHLIKIIQSRTIFLQRRLNENPYKPAPDEASDPQLLSLLARLSAVEASASGQGNQSKTNSLSSPTPPVATLTAEIRRAVQPDLDALNRAVRRYEKRATMQAMQTESRLVDLEIRLNDALSLAAAAAQSGQRQRYGFAAILLDWFCAGVVLPTQAAWGLMILPAKLGSSILSVGGVLLGSRATAAAAVKMDRRTAMRKEGAYVVVDRERLQRRAAKRTQASGREH